MSPNQAISICCPGSPECNRKLIRTTVGQARFADESTPVPKPPHWGGWRVVPDRVEFWKGRQSRVHDRLVYQLGADGKWSLQRLQP